GGAGFGSETCATAENQTEAYHISFHAMPCKVGRFSAGKGGASPVLRVFCFMGEMLFDKGNGAGFVPGSFVK
ncbi:hypothetical protein, partial [Pseudomonas putida]|uniref:hypothetical protein n=2 Tax=Pseudomonas TaxID=286 RepID=UPI001C431434